ncbi:hypothetical protein BDY21DRAFT_85292 [Lineolata rhizophorae]|uniref:Uncharacterized protein n=1 Tax=Lineolata rhizophorae TaxID=578093 RepID=A0A6A6PBS2_9PEZI|nr:hypothetical protein BDY21DRAFT_85292 [Lineolata rhizophorae]
MIAARLARSSPLARNKMTCGSAYRRSPASVPSARLRGLGMGAPLTSELPSPNSLPFETTQYQAPPYLLLRPPTLIRRPPKRGPAGHLPIRRLGALEPSATRFPFVACTEHARPARSQGLSVVCGVQTRLLLAPTAFSWPSPAKGRAPPLKIAASFRVLLRVPVDSYHGAAGARWPLPRSLVRATIVQATIPFVSSRLPRYRFYCRSFFPPRLDSGFLSQLVRAIKLPTTDGCC